MRSRPCPRSLARVVLLLGSLVLLAPGPARTDDLIPDYLYQMVKSSVNPLRVMAANANSVLVREIGAGGESLTIQPFDSTVPIVIARAGGAFPGGGLFRADTQFTRATIDSNANVPFRAFFEVGDGTWMAATVMYSSAAQQFVVLQPFVPVTPAVKAQLDQPFDSSGNFSVRTGAFSDGSGTTVRWLNDTNRETGIVLQTGDKIAGAVTAGETVKTVGAFRIDFQNNIFVSVESDKGNSYLVRFALVANAPVASRWQQAGAARLPAGFMFQQVALNKLNSNQMLVLGSLPGAQDLGLWAVDWAQPNPTAVAVQEPFKVGRIGSISDLSGGEVGLVHAAVTATDESGTTMDLEITVSFDPGRPAPTILGLQPLFNPAQATPLGPASGLADKLAAFGLKSTVFPVSLPTGSGIVVATPIPAAGAAPFTSKSAVTYTAAGGQTFDWLLPGTGMVNWGDGARQPDGSLVVPFSLSALAGRFQETDGTLWSTSGMDPSAGQIFISPNHFGRPTASVNIKHALTVGPTTFPVVTWPGMGAFNPITGIFTFNATGSGAIATDIFGTGDMAREEEWLFYFYSTQ